MTVKPLKRVLIFDRKEMVRHTFSSILTAAGHQPLAVNSAADVSSAIKAQDMDIAIIDLGMPTRIIRNALRSLRKTQPELRVVCVVGRELWLMRRNLKILHEANPDTLLLKPFSPEALINCVESI